MNRTRVLILVVLTGFSALSGYALYEHGIAGLLRLAVANSAVMQTSTDLVIALSFVIAWMLHDARTRRINAVPYVVITLLAGSFGPLLYLFRRSESRRSAAAAATSEHGE